MPFYPRFGDYLANKWHQSSAALSIDEILTHLKAAKLDDSQVRDVKSILEQCDLVCFAGANRDSIQMRSDLELTQKLIASWEQRLK